MGVRGETMCTMRCRARHEHSLFSSTGLSTRSMIGAPMPRMTSARTTASVFHTAVGSGSARMKNDVWSAPVEYTKNSAISGAGGRRCPGSSSPSWRRAYQSFRSVRTVRYSIAKTRPPMIVCTKSSSADRPVAARYEPTPSSASTSFSSSVSASSTSRRRRSAGASTKRFPNRGMIGRFTWNSDQRSELPRTRTPDVSGADSEAVRTTNWTWAMTLRSSPAAPADVVPAPAPPPLAPPTAAAPPAPAAAPPALAPVAPATAAAVDVATVTTTAVVTAAAPSSASSSCVSSSTGAV